jgi:hypothetical protein
MRLVLNKYVCVQFIGNRLYAFYYCHHEPTQTFFFLSKVPADLCTIFRHSSIVGGGPMLFFLPDEGKDTRGDEGDT